MAPTGRRAVRRLEDLLPGWHAADLRRRGAEFAGAVRRSGDDVAATEEAARDLLPWAGNGAVAAAVLTGLGAEGLREALRLLGDGSLSSGSALAGVLAAVLGAPVPPGAAAEVAQVRDGRHVDAGDVRTLDADHVAVGMGAVLAAGRRSGRPGPPPATTREWARQIVARERALGEPVRERLRSFAAPPPDPLQEVLARLARPDAGAQAAELLRAEPTWTTLLARPWDDGGSAFAAAVERAAGRPGDGDVVVRSGLRALATGLGDDGDPAGWTVDRGTATAVAPALADAVAARPEVVTGPLARAAAGAGEEDRSLLRGLGNLSADPDASAVLDRALAEVTDARTAAGYLAVREYGQRLDHALHEFAAQEQAVQRERTTQVVTETLGFVPRGEGVAKVLSVLAVVAGADGTWEGSPDEGRHFPAPAGASTSGAYQHVAALLGTPTAPVSPRTDWAGLAADLLPGGDRLRDAVEAGIAVVEEIRPSIEAGPG